MKYLINRIEETLSAKPNAVIAIDGCCAAGKTTLAAYLSERFGLQVVHMDDFFLLPELRTAERLSRPGGNVHYERFIDEVIGGLNGSKEFCYKVFNCRKGTFDGSVKTNPKLPVIVEGAYSMHPEIPDIYDLKIFLETDCKTQLERIEKRGGADVLETFKSKWIPLENLYFETFKIKDKCDIKLSL